PEALRSRVRLAFSSFRCDGPGSLQSGVAWLRHSGAESTQVECGCGAKNPVLADRTDRLFAAVGGWKLPQHGVSLPRLHLPHDVVFGERPAFLRQYGVDELAGDLAK